MSPVPIVQFKPSRSEKTKTDWFFVTQKTAYNIMLFMIHFNEYLYSHPIDNVKDCICFVKKLRVLLEYDIEYSTRFIHNNATNVFGDSYKYSHLYTIFMHKFYTRTQGVRVEGGIIPIKKVKMHPEWIEEYETYITTKILKQ